MADTKTPRELLRETLERNRREMERWPQWMKDAPPVFDSRPKGHGAPRRWACPRCRSRVFFDGLTVRCPRGCRSWWRTLGGGQ